MLSIIYHLVVLMSLGIFQPHWTVCLIFISKMRFQVSHIFREGNAIADAFSSHAVHLVDSVWLHHLPSFRFSYWARDQSGRLNYCFTKNCLCNGNVVSFLLQMGFMRHCLIRHELCGSPLFRVLQSCFSWFLFLSPDGVEIFVYSYSPFYNILLRGYMMVLLVGANIAEKHLQNSITFLLHLFKKKKKTLYIEVQIQN